MKVLALNGSPRGRNSTTFRMLKPITEGMEKAGASVVLANLSTYRIEGCTGCYSCWSVTPGICYFSDDMQALIDELVSSDLVIYGTPVHTYNLSALLKNFIDRTFPIHAPKLVKDEINKEITSLTHRYNKPNKMLLVANCGFPEYAHFEPVVHYFNHFAKMMNIKYLGEILRPMGEVVKRPKMQIILKQYYSLLSEAGNEIIKYERISLETQEKLKECWAINDSDRYNEIVNLHYQYMQSKCENKS